MTLQTRVRVGSSIWQVPSHTLTERSSRMYIWLEPAFGQYKCTFRQNLHELLISNEIEFGSEIREEKKE